MKTYSISKNSFHYAYMERVENIFSNGIQDDICNYVRQLVFSILLLTFFGVAIPFTFWLVIMPWFSIVYSFFMGIDTVWVAYGLAHIIIFIEVCLAIWLVCYLIFKKAKQVIHNRPPTPPGMTRIWWDSFKDKTCVKLSFEE